MATVVFPDITGFGDQVRVVRSDAFKYLEGSAQHKFDYVYIAPPQYRGLWKKALEHLDSNNIWLSQDAWVIVQIHPREDETLELTHLVEFDRRSYGSTALIFFRAE